MKIKFSFILFLLLILLVINNMFTDFIVYFFCLICHEYSHYFVAKKLGYTTSNVYLTPFGATISVNENVFYSNHEVIIALAGPLFNFFMLIITIACWWIFPQTYSYTYFFSQCNFMLCFFNLLPIYPLDGSRILSHYLNKITKNTKGILIFISIIFTVIFVILSIIYKNFSLLLMASLFLLSLCEKQSSYKPNMLLSLNKNNVLPLNTIVVNQNIPIYKLNKLLKQNSLNRFFVIDDNLNVVKVINQIDLYKIFVENSSLTKLKDIV